MGFMSSKKQDKKEEVFVAPRTIVIPQEKVAIAPSTPSYIGKTMNINADLTSDEDVIIEGRVHGNIVVSKTLTIGKNGYVTADMKAAVVRIIGVAKGNIIASDKVEILSEGRYNGNIESKKLVVAEGAILNGIINKDTKENS